MVEEFDKYLIVMNEKITDLTVEIRLLRKDQEIVKDRYNDISSKLDELMSKVNDYERRFQKIDNIAQYKGSLKNFIERNWWRMILILAPIVAALWELGIYLRNLPVMPT